MTSEDAAQRTAAPIQPNNALSATNRFDSTRNACDFIELFRCFRMAIIPTKLLAIIAAILLLHGAGWLFDAAWGRQVSPHEIHLFATKRGPAYRQKTRIWWRDRARRLHHLLDSRLANAAPATIHSLAASPRAAYARLLAHDARQTRQNQTRALKRIHGELARKVLTARQARDQERGRADKGENKYATRRAEALAAAGRPIFGTFAAYERRQFASLVANTLSMARLENISRDQTPGRGGDGQAIERPGHAAIALGLISRRPARVQSSHTIASALANMFYTGPAWLLWGTAPMRGHPGDGAGTRLFRRAAYLLSLACVAALFAVLTAIVGGAICRQSACQAAGLDTGFFTGLRYARDKLWTFIATPLLPFATLLFIAAIFALLAVAGAVPYVGEVAVAIMFLLFFMGGFIMMLIILGIIGGFHLLYPAVAVEGADAFDAASRGFSYLYTRPWRTLLYAVVTLVYGALTYLFLAFALFVALRCAHAVMGRGTDLFGGLHNAATGQSKLNAIWPRPRFDRFLWPANFVFLGAAGHFAALVIRWWVFLISLILAAYVVSYYFSAATMTYLLLRRAADGQDFGDLCEAGAALPKSRPGAASDAGPMETKAPAAREASDVKAGPLVLDVDASGTAPAADGPI